METPQQRKIRLVDTLITDVHGQDFLDREAAIRDCRGDADGNRTPEQEAVFQTYIGGTLTGPRYNWLPYDPLTLKRRRFR